MNRQLCWFSNNRGQAMLELAIFGSLLLMMLATLVQYGLNADFTQRGIMESYRIALAGTSAQADPANMDNKPTSTSTILFQDRRIPDPASPYGIGSSLPIINSSAGIVRNPRMTHTADNILELPQIQIVSNGRIYRCPSTVITGTPGCITAGFRTELNVHPDSRPRYDFVYGGVNITQSEGDCLTWGTGPTGLKACLVQGLKLKIIDSCEGEIINYDSCVRQARIINSSSACIEACNRVRASDCNNMCSKPMNIPWYAAAYARDIGKGLNGFSAFRDTGLESGYSRSRKITGEIKKTESESEVSSLTTVSVDEHIRRRIITLAKSLDYTVTSTAVNPGFGQGLVNTDNDITSNKTRWTTPW